MEVFENVNNNGEKRIRKGGTVPKGAVSLGWYKAPDLTPENHLVTIDTTAPDGADRSNLSLAYANTLGILEDQYGNQVWPEEFPIVGDEFLNEDDITEASQFLPYVHISRFFHLDYTGLAFPGSLSDFPVSQTIKVVDNKGNEYLDENGNPRYRVQASNVPLDRPSASVDTIYRLWVFLDTDPKNDNLFLTYNKVEYDNATEDIKNQHIQYKEPINAIEYYNYTPEECEVVDQGSLDKRIYSTQAIDLKDQLVGRSQPNYKGWQIQVPKKAIPDPRNFEIFRWRIACEYSRDVNADESRTSDAQPIVNVGVVTFNASKIGQSRANYIFTQLNESSYNAGGIRFVNPLSANSGLTQENADYWSVPIQSTSIEDLSQFDILVWSTSSPSIDIGSEIMPKIEYFVETLGRTFIFETCSQAEYSGIPGVSFSNRLNNINDKSKVSTKLDTLAYFDYQPATPNSTMAGAYGEWPPKIESLMTNNAYSSDLIKELNFLGGWDLDSESELKPSSYLNLNDPEEKRLQYIVLTDDLGWETIVDAERTDVATREPVLARKKNTSGGSYYVSTMCLFEDHIINNLDEDLEQVWGPIFGSDLEYLPYEAKDAFYTAADALSMEGEMKLRTNIFMLATAFRPSTNVSNSPGTGFDRDYERHTVTVYSDWQSSWVINAHNGVLSDEEKARFNFSLLPKDPEDTNPVWMRILSDKTVGELMAEKIKEIDPEGTNKTFQNVSGLKKRYTIMITNQEVETFPYNLIDGNTVPAAWTYSYSPPFNVPAENGPYEIREEMIAGTGVGEGKRIYPPSPYKVRSTASYVTTGVDPHEVNVNVKVTGTARRTFTIPPREIEVPLPVPAYRVGWWVDKKLRWNTDQNTVLTPASSLGSGRPHMGDMSRGMGLDTWTDANYGSNPRPNHWADWSWHGHFYVGARGVIVKHIQNMLNQFVFWGIISGPYLKADSYYGYKTSEAVRKLQVARGALYVNGEVEAETWSLFGYAMAQLFSIKAFRDAHIGDVGKKDSNLLYWFGELATKSLRLENASDSSKDGHYKYMRHSNVNNGPSRISEGFLFQFDPAYSDADSEGNFRMYELWVKPHSWSYDSQKLQYLDWLDVGNNLSLRGYNYSRASHGKKNIAMRSGEYTVIPFSERKANSVIFRMSKSGAAKPDEFRGMISMGLSDVFVMASQYVYNTSPPPTAGTRTQIIEGRTIVEELTIEATQTLKLKYGIPQDLSTSIKNGTWVNSLKVTNIDSPVNEDLSMYPSSISEIRWENIEIKPTSLEPSITATPKVIKVGGQVASKTYTLTYNDAVTTVGAPNYISGPAIGNGTTEFYIKPLGGAVEPFPHSYGWITKDQGVVLITNSNGKPFGFPAAAPSLGEDEVNFTRLTMDAWDHDNTLSYGFYDTKENEWLENSNGEPDISYYDYVRRGVENVYMAVQTSYEIDTQSNLPAPNVPVQRPFKMAMPIYGVKTRNESSVKLRNPSNELGRRDIWPVLVSTGAFTKKVSITQDYADKATNYLRDYGGKTLTVHYSLREELQGPWSSKLGRPFKDIGDERPRLLSDKDIQVNHFPIAHKQEPTYYPNPADPVTPFFTVFRRDTIDGAWVEVAKNEIESYELNKGIITLKTPLVEQDPRLVKVDYTARDYTYRLSESNGSKVNLNPYALRRPELENEHLNVLDKPLYVYLVPSFVVDDETKNVISGSHNEDIVKVTQSKTIFDASQADYDPLAYRLGVVFVLTTADVNDLKILDTRVRGGGAEHHLPSSALTIDSSSYWDVPADKIYSYQKGGFVIIELPDEVLEDFETEDDIRKVIDRNLTAGIGYEIIYKRDGLGYTPLGIGPLGA